MPRKITLSNSLSTHNGEVTELSLRDMTARDMVEIKTSPIVITYTSTGLGESRTQETKVEEHYDRMMQVAEKLTGVDSEILSDLCAKDFRKLCTAIGEAWREAEGE